MAVAKIESRDDLTKESASLFRRQSSLFNQVIEQLPARNMFQDQIAMATRFREETNETGNEKNERYVRQYINSIGYAKGLNGNVQAGSTHRYFLFS